MKRFSAITLILIIWMGCLYGQEYEVEYNNLVQQYKEGAITSAEMQLGIQDIKNWMSKFDTVINVPYNPEFRTIEYTFVFDLPGIDKHTLFERLKEYDATYYLGTNGIDYSSDEFGKLILHGEFEYNDKVDWITKVGFSLLGKVDEYSNVCKFSTCASVKDGRVRITFKNIYLERTLKMRINTGAGIVNSNSIIDYPLTRFYPFTNMPEMGPRKYAQRFLIATDDDLTNHANHIAAFLRDTNTDQGW